MSVTILKIDTGVYEVNGKEVDIRLPKYGKNLKAFEYRALLNYIKALEQQMRWQVEKENRHLFD
jgi:hypothetical protein